LIPLRDHVKVIDMKVISKRVLRQFWESSPKYIDAKIPLEAWHSETQKASWSKPTEIKEQFRSASILKNNRVVFNIAGNKYRLIVSIFYKRQVCYVKFVGTHEQYDKIDAEIYNGH